MMLKHIVMMLVATAMFANASQKNANAANYKRPFEPSTHPAFIPLPPGAVEPEGWLRDWCVTAKNGYTGHMDDYDQAFKQAWAADYTMTGERLNWPKGGWPYEGGGYWFDGLVRLGYALHDDALIQQAKKRLDVVVTHMNANSILFLWWLNKSNPDDMKGAKVDHEWPLWASGLLGRSLVAYYAASGDRRVLQALESAYSGNRDWLRMGWSMSNPWPAFDTYTWTGNKDIAAGLTALFSKDGGGIGAGGNSWNRYRRKPGDKSNDSELQRRLLQQTINDKPGAETNDHVVHFLESTTPWALGYLWTGNPEFLESAFAWHRHLERESMQPSGVPVADEWYGSTGAFRGTETCDVAGYLWSQIALLTISGEGSTADRAERAFFNAGPAVVSRDFKTHVYFQTPNRIVDMNPRYSKAPPRGQNSYKAKQWPLCCTAALNRILPNYVMHMWMATYDNGLAATHYGPSKVSALVAEGVPVTLESRTQYPFNDVIDVSVNPAHIASFPLSFRIPGWCKTPELKVNGSTVKATPDAKGFVRIERSWKPGDAVRLRFPMSVSIATERDKNSHDAPYATVSYGPLLFALPIADTKDANTPDPAATWNCALDVRGKRLGADIRVERQAMPAKWDWPLAAPLKLRANAVDCKWTPSFEEALPAKPVVRHGKTKRITLIPFGCTKFRVSMFPVTAELWEAQSR
ncbi:MAG: beta-L-arabinofuranosidase domain-containing protein [Bryobacteraceae bacterium]